MQKSQGVIVALVLAIACTAISLARGQVGSINPGGDPPIGQSPLRCGETGWDGGFIGYPPGWLYGHGLPQPESCHEDLATAVHNAEMLANNYWYLSPVPVDDFSCTNEWCEVGSCDSYYQVTYSKGLVYKIKKNEDTELWCVTAYPTGSWTQQYGCTGCDEYLF